MIYVLKRMNDLCKRMSDLFYINHSIRIRLHKSFIRSISRIMSLGRLWFFGLFILQERMDFVTLEAWARRLKAFSKGRKISRTSLGKTLYVKRP